MAPTDHIPLCTIAGSDPTGGAGLQGDLKTFAAHGGTGTAVVTAITVQGRSGVARIELLPPDLVAEQLEVVLAECRPVGLKTGMLGGAAQIRAIAEVLATREGGVLVVDPVMAATAGGDLLAAGALPALLDLLIPRAQVLTPNLGEGARLLGRETLEEGEMEDAARALLDLGCGAVLLKGGHGTGAEAVDVLATPDGEVRRLSLPRLQGVVAHGTGCALAAALTARLAGGTPLVRAAALAKASVPRALAAAAARGPGAALVHGVRA